MSSFGDDERSIDAVQSVSDYTRQVLTRDELKDIKHLEPLLNWWRQVNEETHRLPSRKDFNPTAFQNTLPHLAIFEPIYKDDELINCKTVLIGTELTKVYGEATGELSSTINNEYVAQTVLSSTKECIRRREPLGVTAKAVSKELPFLRSFALYCPLSTDHTNIDKILVHVVFENISPTNLSSH